MSPNLQLSSLLVIVLFSNSISGLQYLPFFRSVEVDEPSLEIKNGKLAAILLPPSVKLQGSHLAADVVPPVAIKKLEDEKSEAVIVPLPPTTAEKVKTGQLAAIVLHPKTIEGIQQGKLPVVLVPLKEVDKTPAIILPPATAEKIQSGQMAAIVLPPSTDL